ncbi:uncharacterized protein LOC132272511 [Cornus florida]|uniref:uncharacterized protein LOC132272511 n=1 Tax=Cornus florida TaxID=4283 RepID=UPI0028A2D081|nr:uncharacterized protein LOC132272511 [Cornus florida]
MLSYFGDARVPQSGGGGGGVSSSGDSGGGGDGGDASSSETRVMEEEVKLSSGMQNKSPPIKTIPSPTRYGPEKGYLIYGDARVPQSDGGGASSSIGGGGGGVSSSSDSGGGGDGGNASSSENKSDGRGGEIELWYAVKIKNKSSPIETIHSPTRCLSDLVASKSREELSPP